MRSGGRSWSAMVSRAQARTVLKLDVIEIIGREEVLPSCMITLFKALPQPHSEDLARQTPRLSWVTSQ